MVWGWGVMNEISKVLAEKQNTKVDFAHNIQLAVACFKVDLQYCAGEHAKPMTHLMLK